MAGRGGQTFSKRLKEQQRKERQQEKFARRMQRKHEQPNPAARAEDDAVEGLPLEDTGAAGGLPVPPSDTDA
jgi:hypothetical protein